jgi:putative membrane protein
MRNILSDKALTAKLLLAVFFSVGIAGMAIPATRDRFISLTPLALILSITALFFFHRPYSLKKEIILFVFIFLTGFFVEVIGVKTGRIFGIYKYGQGLGPLVLETPVMIGANWALLVYCTAVIADKLGGSDFIKIISGSAIMLAYDMILEKAAPLMLMWSFEGDDIPWRNFASWFLLAVIFHSLLKLFHIRIENRIAPFIIYVQAVFFIILIIILKFAQ